MNQPYARVNQPYATLTLASALREMFGVQLYKNNARALLSRILGILNLDWLQHARSVRGVYEFDIIIHSKVFALFLQAVEELNIKTKNWKDLLTDEPFVRKDLIVLQDPANLDKFNITQFHHVQNNIKVQSEGLFKSNNLRHCG